MDSAKKILEKKTNNGKISKIKSFEEVLTAYRTTIKDSQMFKDLCEALDSYITDIDRIRCLAIGTFHDDTPAKYQLALLLELVDFIKVKGSSSIYILEIKSL